MTNTFFSPRRFAGVILLCTSLATGVSAHAAGQGYVVTKTGDGVQIATGTPPADQATRLALPLRFETVTVTGMPDALADRVRARASDRVGRTGRAADVFALAQEIENLHREAGFALARVYLPPQRVRNGGSLRIEVVDVRLEGFDLEGLPPMVAERVRHHLSPLLGRSLLRTDDLARAVGLLQIEFGVTFKVEPLEGSQPDRVRLQVRGPTKSWIGDVSGFGLVSRPFSHFLFSGNLTSFMPAALGGRLSVGGAVGQREEQAAAGPLFTAGAVYAVPLDLPIDAFAEVGVAGARVIRKAPVLALTDIYEFGRVYARMGLPLLVSGTQSILMKVGPDFTGEMLTSRTVLPYRVIDQDSAYTGVLRAELIWVAQYANGISTEAGLLGTLGQTRGARHVVVGEDSAGENRTNAIGLITARARVVVPVWWDAYVAVAGRAQFSALGPLPLSEQFQLFRAAEATAFDPETDQGESGVVGRIELGRRFPAEWVLPGAALTPYVFGGGGAIWKVADSFGRRIGTGETWGVGATLALPPLADFPVGATLGVELYRQVSTTVVPDYTGLTLRLSARF
ncbi:POTRA domain-containing protein [Methylobacterium aquaticum]|uniref:POTRA domain-containing protein n=1 Tax=Methylobacterium aquaticum TaxID=270351 RepID=UPI003D17F9F9